MSAASQSVDSYANHLAMHRVVDCYEALRERGLGVRDLAVLMVIARHCNRENRCWLSYGTIAKESLQARRTCIKVVSSLVAAEFLTKLGEHSSGANLYEVVHRVHQCTACTSAPQTLGSAPQTLGGCTACTRVVSAVHQGGARGAPEVVPELVPQVVPGNSTNYVVSELVGSQQDSADGSQVDTKQATAKTQGSNPANPSPAPPPSPKRGGVSFNGTASPPSPRAPAPAAQDPVIPDDSEGGRLSRLFWEKLGSPASHKPAAAIRWVEAFERLAATHTEAKIEATIRYTFATKFWLDIFLRLKKQDPVEYLIKQLDQLMGQMLEEVQKKKSSAQPTAKPPSTPAAASRWQTDDLSEEYALLGPELQGDQL